MYPVVKPTWKQITYRGLTNQRQKPSIQYTPYTSDAPKIGRTHVSVSHDGEYVYSTVIIEGVHPQAHNLESVFNIVIEP